jgi:putative ATP-dependent endonuclease of OLD family
MYIKEVKIKNFRSIVNPVNKTIKCEKFNVFIGQNNHGKSNIFRVLDWFFNGGDFAEHQTKGSSEYPEVEIVFGDAGSGLNAMLDRKDIIEKYIDNEDNIIIIREVRDNRARLFIVDNEGKKHNPAGIDGALRDYLPKFRYINARDHADKHDGYRRRNVIGELLSDIVERVTKDDEFNKFKQAFSEFIKKTFNLEQGKISNKIKEYLNEQFDNTIKEFSLTLVAPEFEDLMKNFTIRLDDGAETRIDEKGDGIQRALIIAMFRLLSEEQGDGNGKKTIFCIDEVENHLHVATQRLMVDSFYKMIEKGGQVFINTHSPVFMQSGEDRAIFKVEKSGNETKIEPQGEGDFHQLL